MSPTGRGGTRHQRRLAALLDPAPAAALGHGAARLGPRDESAPRIALWWEP